MTDKTPAVHEALAVYAPETVETDRVPPGYRQTEVGMIPEDWETVSIGTIAKFTSGVLIKTSALHRQSPQFPVPVFGGNGVAGYTSDAVATTPTVVIGRVGQKCGSVYRTGGPAWITDNALYPKQVYRAIDVDFLALALEGARLNEVRNRNDLPLITQSIVHDVLIAVPKFTAEQRAIAAALSDVDALISGLDKLIAKKRAVKTAAMQQLLTGKQRLPGFSGEWEVKRLGDVFAFLSTANNPRSDLSDHGEIGYVHYGDLHATTSSVLDCSKVKTPRIARRMVKNVPLLEEGDLIMVDASEDYEGVGKSVEVRNLNGSKLVAGLHTFLLRGNKESLANGFKGYLQYIPSVRSALVRLATGISVYGISKNNVRNVEVSLPPLGEQTAIAAVLSDMDAEIAALEGQREKTRRIKQGMMQELLTGRTRLV